MPPDFSVQNTKHELEKPQGEQSNVQEKTPWPRKHGCLARQPMLRKKGSPVFTKSGWKQLWSLTKGSSTATKQRELISGAKE
jgi:hypothetical protein